MTTPKPDGKTDQNPRGRNDLYLFRVSRTGEGACPRGPWSLDWSVFYTDPSPLTYRARPIKQTLKAHAQMDDH